MVLLEKYEVIAENIKVIVNIEKNIYETKYFVKIPLISKISSILVSELKRRLILEVNLGNLEILDPNIMKMIKDRFKASANKVLNDIIPNIDNETKEFLIGNLMNDMLGLGNLEFLLSDINLEEVVIVSANEPIRVYHKKYGWLETNIKVESETQIINYANIIARRVGRKITTLSPLLDAHLISGDRSNAVLYPIAHKGNTITIRKFARDPWTVTDFITNNTCPSEIFALIWLAIQYEMNILISGGTASGKTSFLNVIMPFIPPNHRIVSIEDTPELQLPKFLYWTPLTVRPPNTEGKGEISMIDLLVNSLRMRPDRIIMGEIRKGDQAEVLFEAMHTGHSVYATVHADSISETIKRLTNPPINISQNLLSAVNLNVVMFRDRRKGIRRIYQIGEYISGEEGSEVRPNILYRMKPNEDKIVEHSPSLRLFDDLSVHTGMSQQEIINDLFEKEKILKFMAKNNIRELNKVGELINRYYANPDDILKNEK